MYGNDLTYMIYPIIMGYMSNVKTISDIVFLLALGCVLICVLYVAKKLLHILSRKTKIIFNGNQKSMITIPVMLDLNKSFRPGLKFDNIPDIYMSILYHMHVNKIDTKYIKLISYVTDADVFNLNDKRNELCPSTEEKDKFKYFIDYPFEIKINSDIYISSTCVRDDASNGHSYNTPNNMNVYIMYDVYVCSYTLNELQLKKTLEQWTEEYKNHLKNLNKDKLFCLVYEKSNDHSQNNARMQGMYFEDMMVNQSKKEEIASFEIYEFKTNKSFDNIFFEQKDLLLRKLDYFKNGKEEYKRLGNQYSLGLMFHGKPGCGKTSTAKAIAVREHRHLVIIPFSKVKTFKDLRNIFFTKEYESINLNFDKKIILLEDIDCMADIINERTEKDENNHKSNKSNKPNKLNVSNMPSASTYSKPLVDVLDNEIVSATPEYDNLNLNIFDNDNNNVVQLELESINNNINTNTNTNDIQKEDDTKDLMIRHLIDKSPKSNDNDKITLSDILNLIDGVLEQPGRMMIITTNYPEKIDKALKRFGRIDLEIEFKTCSKEIAKQIIEYHYKQSINGEFTITPYKFSPAEIQQICFQYDDMYDAIQKLKY